MSSWMIKCIPHNRGDSQLIIHPLELTVDTLTVFSEVFLIDYVESCSHSKPCMPPSLTGRTARALSFHVFASLKGCLTIKSETLACIIRESFYYSLQFSVNTCKVLNNLYQLEEARCKGECERVRWLHLRPTRPVPAETRGSGCGSFIQLE